MKPSNRSRTRVGVSTLAVDMAEALNDEALPNAFRLFVSGMNRTENGDFLFDGTAAEQVMRNYHAHGVDRMIDLEHKSVDADHINYDPDARGWAKLELRSDGSLWATEVRWTPDGERRLRERTQRYVSPAFAYDEKSRRIKSILNVAITALPATHKTEALMAASTAAGTPLEQLPQIAEALGLGPDATVEDILATIAALAESLKKATAPTEAPAAASAETPPGEELAAAARIRQLSGRPSLVEALPAVEAWHTAHAELSARETALAGQRAIIEAAERRKLVGELVKLGGEIPSTAWADDAGTVPVQRLSVEPIGDLRSRVAALSASKANPGRTTGAAPRPATTGELAGMTERERKICADTGADPARFMAARRHFKGV